MKKQYCKLLLAALTLSASVCGYAAAPVVSLGAPAVAANAPAKVAVANTVVINGTGQTGTFTVNASNLPDRVTLTASAGFEVYPTVLPADAQNATVRVTLLSTMPQTTGLIVLRSGDFRAEVPVVGYGSALEQKDLSAAPVFTGDDKTLSKGVAEGFTPGENGYTVEFRVQVAKETDTFEAYGVTPGGASFKAYVEPKAMGLYNGSKSKVAFENPLNNAAGGKKSFYNADGKFHTYRYAVTSDNRVFVYRDGIQVAALRAADYGNQPEWALENGDLVENLLKNGDFEGEKGYRATDTLLNKVEGWIVDPIDQYNCNYDVENLEINNELDHYNHAMMLKRYNWNDGWGAGTVSQIIDVAPNSTYSLSFLAMGGYDKKTDAHMSSVKIQEVQDTRLGTSVTINNEDKMEEYGLNYTTSADCKQIKVVLHNERFLNGGGWGSSPTKTYFDEMTLSGVSRTIDQKVGFSRNTNTKLEYFTYDVTGAYAPVTPVLEPEQSAVVIEGTGSSKDVKVSIANLVSADKVKVSATPGFSVFPETLDPGKDGQIRVTLTSTLPETTGKVILRSGDLRTYIDLTGYASELEAKDIKGAAAYKDGNDNTFAHSAADGFTAGENGYTVEFRVKVDKSTDAFEAYGVTTGDAAFKAYVEPEAIGLYNRASKVAIANPATAADGGKKQFYNNDGKFHTYRYAVTSDKRVIVYRDGLQVANLRTTDYGHQPEWAIENGDIAENLLKNANFEGEYNYRESDGLLNRVEGWIVDPIDQYNCNYDVEPLEINNELDHNNHAMMLKRYNWNDGWGAGTVSQIVDVAPNSTYSLSFLAMGGYDSKTDAHMSSVKIQEAQDTRKGESVTITSDDAMAEYGLNYTTSADCSQIKVVLYNERFLNGGGWGSHPEKTYVDEMTLTGVSRKLDQKVGFDKNTNTKIEYFAYDATGAYAPLAPGFGDDFVGVDAIEAANEAYAVAAGDGIAVYNVTDGASVAVYDTLGVLVASYSDYAAGSVIALPRRGLYLCVVSGADSSKTLKVVY